MKDMPIVALMYDFDRTLSPRDMEEYAFIPGLGMSAYTLAFSSLRSWSQ